MLPKKKKRLFSLFPKKVLSHFANNTELGVKIDLLEGGKDILSSGSAGSMG